MVLSTQEFSLHAHWLVCLNFTKYVIQSCTFDLVMLLAKFGCRSMYAG